MPIGSRQRIATFRSVRCSEIDGVPINKVLQAKSLGVHLHENLSWNIQINELTQKDCFWYWRFKTCSIICPSCNIAINF